MGATIALVGPESEIDPAAAARIVGAYKAESERRQDLPQPADKNDYQRIEARVRASAGESYPRLEAEGRDLDLDSAIQLAREVLSDDAGKRASR